MLPSGLTVVGIDEQTALVFDLAAGSCSVLGKGGVTILRDGQEHRFGREASFAAGELGPFHPPQPLSGVQAEVYEHTRTTLAEAQAVAQPAASPEVIALVEQREDARARGDWSMADDLRVRVAALGWQVSDAAEGPRLEPIHGEVV
jgi:cyanophycinase-like exopeptidase